MVYTSQSLALAALEYLVHLDPIDAPDDLVSVSAEIPGSLRIVTIRIEDLPPRWRSYPAPEELAALGTDWVDRRTSAALRVPSVIVPSGFAMFGVSLSSKSTRHHQGANREAAGKTRNRRGR